MRKLYVFLFLLCLGCGTVAAQSLQWQTFYTFPDYNNLTSSLVQLPDGNIYGIVNDFSGTTGTGVEIYRLNSLGSPTIVHVFPGSASYQALAGSMLLPASDGNLYGLVAMNASITLFKLTPAGVYSSVWSEGVTSGYYLNLSLIESPDGLLYGTTGTGFAGNVFSYALNTGTFTTLHSFTSGSQPTGQLMQGKDGYLYGTLSTPSSGDGPGALYRIQATAPYTFTQLFSTSNTPYTLASSLVQLSNGKLAGVAETGEYSSTPQFFVYEFNASGSYDVLYSFPSGIQFVSASDLAAGSDGKIYGIEEDPGSEVYSLFALDTTGHVQTTGTFNTGYPDNSFTLLRQFGDGSFYTTDEIGSSMYVYRWAPAAGSQGLPMPVQLSVSPQSAKVGTPITVTWDLLNGFSQSAQLCFGSGDWSGILPPSGQVTITPSAPVNATMSLTCGGYESAIAYATVYSTQAASQVSLLVSPAKANVGDSIFFSATANSAKGSGATPTGRVEFQTNGQTFATVPLNSSGSASFQLATSNFPAGPNQIAAVYLGDSNYSVSASSVVGLTLIGTPVVTGTVTPAGVGQGQPVSVAVHLAAVNGGPIPTGTVALSGPLSATLTLVNGSATYNTTASVTTYGQSYIYLNYSGDANYAAASSQVSYTVLPAAVLSLSAAPTQVVRGQSVTLVAQVNPSSSYGIAPTGNVVFRSSGLTLGTASIDNSYATFTASSSPAPVGRYAVTATYQGDANNGTATSSPIYVTVTAQ